MRLSRTTEYAMQAALLIARSTTDGPVSCAHLAASSTMPERFLLQILRNLVTHGILRSTRGVHGGYMLDRRPDQITLCNLIEAVEGPVTGYLASSNILSVDTQDKVRVTLNNVAASTRLELNRLSLANLLQSTNGGISATGTSLSA